MTYAETIQTGIDYLPKAIAVIRDLIVKLILALNLPETTSYIILVGILSFVIAYYFLKQFVVSSMFWRMGTLINWAVMSLLIYILLTYV